MSGNKSDLDLLRDRLSVFRVDRSIYNLIETYLDRLAAHPDLFLLSAYLGDCERRWPRSAVECLSDLNSLSRGRSPSPPPGLSSEAARVVCREILTEESDFALLQRNARNPEATPMDHARLGEAINRRVVETGHAAHSCSVELVFADGRLRLMVERSEVEAARAGLRFDLSMVRFLRATTSALVDPVAGRMGLDAIDEREWSVARFDVSRLRQVVRDVERPVEFLADLREQIVRTRESVHQRREKDRMKFVAAIQHFVDLNLPVEHASFRLFLTQDELADVGTLSQGKSLTYSSSGMHLERDRHGATFQAPHRMGAPREPSGIAYLVSNCGGITEASVRLPDLGGFVIVIDREAFLRRMRVSTRPDKVLLALRESWSATDRALNRQRARA